MITGTVIILGALLLLVVCFMRGQSKPATFGQQFSANPVTKFLYQGWNGT